MPNGATLRTSPDKGVPNGFAPNQNACKEPCRTRSRGSFLASKRPERGRYLLQVDRQTKNSYTTSEAAQSVALAIKTGYPIVQMSVYDSVEHTHTMVEVPAASS